MIGSKIDDKYIVKRLLGQGGMGSVYETEHASTGRRCAVKVINAGDLTKDTQVLGRFEREARAAGAIDTQYITQVLDAGLDRTLGLPFIAMEYMEGEDFQRLLKRVGPVSPDLTLRVIAQTCLGLAKAHEAKVVHRDIKPHNLFLCRRDAGEVVVKILDFGIAKVKMDQAQTKEGADLTRTGNLLGSPLYVSPEQARGKRQIDHRTDIYSLGAVAYQALCGRTPYEHATALGELILMVCTEPPPPVQDHAPWVTPAVAEIIHKCLRKNPDERFQTATELFNAVKRLLPDGWTINDEMLVSLADSQRQEEAPRLPVSEYPPDIDNSGTFGALPANTSVGASTTNGSAVAAPQPEAQGSKIPLVAVSLLVVAIAAGGVWALTRPPPAPAAPPESAEPTTPPEPSLADTGAAPDPAPKKPLRVKVAVRPDTATVEVDGKVVKTKDGLLELEGTPGKVFVVKASQGTGSTEGEVIITEEGPRPPLIEVVSGKNQVLKREGPPKPNSSADAQPKTGTDPGPVPKPPPDDEGEFDK